MAILERCKNQKLPRALALKAKVDGGEKLSEYECGFPAFEEPRDRFDVRFYLIAILFIIFDLEAAFLFPWAVSLDLTGWPGWITMMVFLAELIVGLIYAWKKGALDWE